MSSLVPALLLLARTVVLPPGETHLHAPFEPRNASVQGSAAGSTLVMDADFQGSAAIVIEDARDIALTGFTIRGNRGDLNSNRYLPLNEAAFADFYPDNGILIRRSARVSLRAVSISRVRSFPILVNASTHVTVDSCRIFDSGSLDSEGHNNTTGGILFEEGVSSFEVARSYFTRLTGTAIWTHSYARSPRNRAGSVHHNAISFVARDAIQIGHATHIDVAHNQGSSIGYPPEQVDAARFGTPVALDTAGNVDETVYRENRFTDVNGECINLDGFHHGSVTGNSCINEKPLAAYPWSHYAVIFGNHDPGMQSEAVVITGNTLRGFAYGAVFLAGSGNRIADNRFTRLNLAQCGTTPVPARCNYAPDEPDLLRSGIYVSDSGGRPTASRGNVIERNLITGFGISRHCIAAKAGVDLRANTLRANRCE